MDDLDAYIADLTPQERERIERASAALDAARRIYRACECREMTQAETPERAETRVYDGLIQEHQFGENWNALFVGNAESPLAEQIKDDIDDYGHYLSVRYFISDEPRTADELETNLADVLTGATDARYEDRYSEITGYLWTDEDVMIGGHDLIDELRGYAGKFVRLEIRYHRTPPAIA